MVSKTGKVKAVVEQAVTLEEVRTDSLKPHPDNPNVGDVRAIKASIEANGWYGTVVVQRSTNFILAGNHSWKAAMELGIEFIPVAFSDCDDATAKRILLADNRIASFAEYDNVALTKLLSELATEDTLAGTGWEQDDITDLLTLLEREQPLTTDEMEGAIDDVKGRSITPRIVIDTTADVVEQFNALDGESNNDKLVALLARPLPQVEEGAGT